METLQEVVIILATAIAPILAALLVAALTKWMQKMGIDIEAKNRDALQTALSNAAMVAVGSRAFARDKGAAVQYVKDSVPDAVKKFGLTDDRIAEILQPHIVRAETAKSAASAALVAASTAAQARVGS